MHPLNTTLAELQRSAAGLSADELQDEILASLDVLAEDIAAVRALGPYSTATEVVSTTDYVMIAALFTAIYLRELVNRPPPRRFARFRLCLN